MGAAEELGPTPEELEELERLRAAARARSARPPGIAEGGDGGEGKTPEVLARAITDGLIAEGRLRTWTVGRNRGRSREFVIFPPRTLDNGGELIVPREQVAETLLRSRAGRRALAAASVDFFKVYYLDLYAPACQSRWIDAALEARRHLQLAPRDHGKTETLTRVLPLWIVCMSLSGLRPDLVPEDVRILLIGKIQETAKKFLRSIKAELEANARLLEDFGPFREDGESGKRPGSWTETYVYCRRRKLGVKDPTIAVTSARGTIVGGRADFIIADDLEDEATVNTAEQRQKTRRWFLGTIVELLEPRGRMVAIGTRKHADDLYSHLLKNPMWTHTIDRAVIRWPGGLRSPDPSRWDYVTKEVPLDHDDPAKGVEEKVVGLRRIDAGGVVLWPAKWNLARLLLKRLEVGSFLFARENQQDPIDDDATQFPIEWLRRALRRGSKLPLYRAIEWTGTELVPLSGGAEALPPGLRRLLRPPGWTGAEEVSDPEQIDPHAEPLGAGVGELLIFQGWDLSLVDDEKKQETRDTDYTVGITLGLNYRTKDLIVLDVFRARKISPQTIKDAITMSAAAWNPMYVSIEVNSFGRLHEAGLRRSTDLPIIRHKTGRNKLDPYVGVTALSVLFENGKFVLPYLLGRPNRRGREIVDVLVSELYGLGVEAHDDMVMALWIVRDLVRRYVAKMERGRRTAKRPARPRPGG